MNVSTRHLIWGNANVGNIQNLSAGVPPFQAVTRFFYLYSSFICPAGPVCSAEEEVTEMFKNCLENVRKTVPLVHNITNYVTVNDVGKCAARLRRKPDHVR